MLCRLQIVLSVSFAFTSKVNLHFGCIDEMLSDNFGNISIYYRSFKIKGVSNVESIKHSLTKLLSELINKEPCRERRKYHGISSNSYT